MVSCLDLWRECQGCGSWLVLVVVVVLVTTQAVFHTIISLSSRQHSFYSSSRSYEVHPCTLEHMHPSKLSVSVRKKDLLYRLGTVLSGTVGFGCRHIGRNHQALEVE